MVDPAAFRRWMGAWATGVSVVTARAAERDHGLTVNAFLSVALEPPTVLVSLQDTADSTPIVERTGAFAVNLLAHDQRALSERFARAIDPATKFEGIELARGSTGAALLPGTLGAIEARVVGVHPIADHRVLVGEVVALHPGREVAPLLFFRARYASSDGRATLTLGAPPAPPKR